MKIYSRKSILVLFILLACFQVHAQFNSMNLESCIKQAIDNNIRLKKSELTVQSSEINLKRDKYSRFPTLNIGSNLNVSTRAVDPTNNDLVSSAFYSNGLNLTSGMPLFQGGQIHYSIKKSELNGKFANEQLEQQKWELIKQVTLAYLDVIFAQENLLVAQLSKENNELQLEQINKLILAGSKPESEKFQLLANIATAQQNIVAAEGNLNRSKLILKQVMQWQSDEELNIEIAEIDMESITDPDIVLVEDFIKNAKKQHPSMRLSNMRVTLAELDEKISKSGYYPRLSIGASLGSNYSSLGKEVESIKDVYNTQIVQFNGSNVEIGFPSKQITFKDQPYFAQLKNNISFGYGMNLSIPIFNGLNVRSGHQQAKIAVENARLDQLETENQLYQELQKIILDGRNAKASYEAAKLSLDASQLAFENAEKRLKLNVGNSFEVATLKNQYDSVRSQWLRAKYQYIFMSKMIDYYLGKPITL